MVHVKRDVKVLPAKPSVADSSEGKPKPALPKEVHHHDTKAFAKITKPHKGGLPLGPHQNLDEISKPLKDSDFHDCGPKKPGVSEQAHLEHCVAEERAKAEATFADIGPHEPYRDPLAALGKLGDIDTGASKDRSAHPTIGPKPIHPKTPDKK